MRVLIIEDDQNKRRQLREYIAVQFVSAEIVERYSYQSGLRELLNSKYDLVLLDMTMPTYDITPSEPGGRPRIFGGREILHQMLRLKIFAPVIVVTQFDVFGEGPSQTKLPELDKELHAEFRGIYMGSVFYSAASEQWKPAFQRIYSEMPKREKP